MTLHEISELISSIGWLLVGVASIIYAAYWYRTDNDD